MRRSCFEILTISYIVGMMVFIWHIDISTGAIWRDNILTNGWLDFDPMQIYHISLYCVIIITILFAIIVTMAINKNKRFGTNVTKTKQHGE